MASHYRIPPRTLPEKQLCIRINLLKTGPTVVSELKPLNLTCSLAIQSLMIQF